MTTEGKTLIQSMIINIFISFSKIISGIMCNSKSMVADGFHSLSDFITDVVAYFGSKYSKKRANKEHPNGYGRIEYIVDFFIALVILLLGVYTISNSFNKKEIEFSAIWMTVIILSIILKIINSKMLMTKGLECNSPILITSSKESSDDVISSLGVIIIFLISQSSHIIPILKYADILGSIIIGCLIIKTSVKLVKENIELLLGKIEENKEVKTSIENLINEYEEIQFKEMELESHGSYYVLQLEISIIENIKVYKLLKIESELRTKIKKLNYRIKFIDINISKAETKKNS